MGDAPARARTYAPGAMWKGLASTLGFWTIGAVFLRVAVVPAEHCPEVTADTALLAATASGEWIERALQLDGSYLYEYDIKADAVVPGYNVVRHAGVTMSLYQLAAEGEARFIAPADRALAWMERNFVAYDGWQALRDPADGEIELGANALLLAGLAQRRIATADGQHDTLMRAVGRYIVTMQRPDGSFLRRWLPETGAPDPSQRSKYATGEAFWALTLMHRLFPGEGWDTPARLVADYLATRRDTEEGLSFPPWADQWAAYGLAEMASWPLSEVQVTYARSLAERFGFLMRAESRRTGDAWSRLIHGRRARAAGMGTWVEGLDSLWRLAAADPRMADMAPKLRERAICGAGMLRDRQVDGSEAARYESPAIAEGAWFTNGKTRMDDQQHALSGLIRVRALIEDGVNEE